MAGAEDPLPRWLTHMGGGEEAPVPLHAGLSPEGRSPILSEAPATSEQGRSILPLMLPPLKPHTPSLAQHLLVTQLCLIHCWRGPPMVGSREPRGHHGDWLLQAPH